MFQSAVTTFLYFFLSLTHKICFVPEEWTFKLLIPSYASFLHVRWINSINSESKKNFCQSIMRYFIIKFQPLFSYIYKVVISVFLSVCLSDHNSGTPGRILSWFWDNNLRGSTFFSNIWFPGKIDQVRANVRINYELVYNSIVAASYYITEYSNTILIKRTQPII